VMVGNSWDNDVMGANRSGIDAIWLTNPEISTRADTRLLVQCPPWVVPVWDLSDVPEALEILRRIAR